MSRYRHFALTTALVSSLVGSADAIEEYTVVFNATWSEQTHPVGFPNNPHFSGLIGGTHESGVTFWAPGEFASDGIESMAETGSKSLLQGEVNSAITAGTAEFLLSGGGIGTSPDSVVLTFNVTEQYPLVTLVSMVAPSPDWFVGVHDLNLYEGNQWANEIIVDLYVYDAGTDSGTGYTSPDNDTNPPDPIALLESGPFAVTGLVGSFRFSRTTSVHTEQSTWGRIKSVYGN